MKKQYIITTQKAIRHNFWLNHPDANRKRMRSGDYCTDTRCAFVDYVENLHRNGFISEELAYRATL